MAIVEERKARANAELDRRVRIIAEREGIPPAPIRVVNAADLDEAERAQFGFPADFVPREPTRGKRRARR